MVGEGYIVIQKERVCVFRISQVIQAEGRREAGKGERAAGMGSEIEGGCVRTYSSSKGPP